MASKHKQSGQKQAIWHAALYARLSREDGDKTESDSISNQRSLLERYAASLPDVQIVDVYADDGFTGTNFARPAFQRMIADVESGHVDCIIVKDLSRFGRDYIDTGRYLERYFPERGVRFIAVSDDIDSENKPYSLLLPFQNVLNEQYARDISKKVRAAMQSKQKQGAFIGAFASYGYQKDPGDHNHLIIDPPAAAVVKRIFDLFENGMGKIKIAKLLNEEGIPCPSVYKRLQGARYQNGQRLDSTSYWTYSTIHRMLHNRMYAGDMEQGKTPRRTMHGKAKKAAVEDWFVVSNTHEAIIQPDQWARVQALLEPTTKNLNFEENISPFSGFLRCGDCGRAMCKTKSAGGIYYSCGSYKRYGASVCTKHSISHAVLEQIVLEDLNKIIAAVGDLQALANEVADTHERITPERECEKLNALLERVIRLKKSAYEDYCDGLLSREELLQYREDYQRQEKQIKTQLAQLMLEQADPLKNPWVDSLLKRGRLEHLDRTTVAETVKQILIFENGKIEITYNFFDDLGILNAD